MVSAKVKKGDTVKVHYTGTLDDGEVFDSSENRDPLSFQAGGGQVIKGFDEGIIGMAVGEEKHIKIPAKDAYGERNETLKQAVPKAQLPPNLQDAKKGMFLRFMAPNGQPISVMIADETADGIILDMNHPLAGKNLNFKVKIVAIGE